jgi:hypothetical protein
VRETLLRISGAIQVLEEALSEESELESATTDNGEVVAAAALSEETSRPN